jgi:hypothetical protein
MFSLAANHFSPNLNHILIGLYVPINALKNKKGLWGDFFELFSLRSVTLSFSQNRCTKSIANTTGIALVMVLQMGKLWQA